MSTRHLLVLGIVVCLGSGLIGCGRTAHNVPPGGTASGGPSATAVAGNADTHADDHSGWWCAEHGVPEEICALCDKKLVAGLKAKGDWCEKHDRPESQCFACHPEKQAEYASQYEAKYGKQPPKPTDNGA